MGREGVRFLCCLELRIDFREKMVRRCVFRTHESPFPFLQPPERNGSTRNPGSSFSLIRWPDYRIEPCETKSRGTDLRILTFV